MRDTVTGGFARVGRVGRGVTGAASNAGAGRGGGACGRTPAGAGYSFLTRHSSNIGASIR